VALQDGRSPLAYAARRGQATICRLLLANGADVNDADEMMRSEMLCC